VRPGLVFDVVELLAAEGAARLRRYSAGDGVAGDRAAGDAGLPPHMKGR
jgi:hypothetical protein